MGRKHAGWTVHFLNVMRVSGQLKKQDPSTGLMENVSVWQKH